VVGCFWVRARVRCVGVGCWESRMGSTESIRSRPLYLHTLPAITRFEVSPHIDGYSDV
jgi:hypothetical protein